ncbi:leucine-rich repeats and immunoglobulin-like domains protein 2 [Lingula anatina]|uniref:Leucine-rich repeats and immunoglobulin-like domains protein 2 n=1 Tax=Lingula anatina TaxID=7574 RepID=A0A1S3KDX6_LINAN|nr:leucine-rich repeats and immunoglobulin-like domains protein 2 [Lingula anatina]|eukprot:XP_013420828.1 leucine-rich repeats and immunoglobulin-like domains protein 2 [Lingula anatina]
MSLPKQETKTYLSKKMDLRDILLLCASLLVAAPSICQGACSINPYCSYCVNYTAEGQTKWRFHCNPYSGSYIDSSHFTATNDTVDVFRVIFSWYQLTFTINNGSFGNIPNILRMDFMSRYEMTLSISPLAFSHGVQNNTRSLLLSYSNLTTVPLALRYLTTLLELHLVFNGLTGDPANYLSRLTSLQSLTLDNNRPLRSIPTSLEHLPYLRKLSLSGCSLNQSSVASFDKLPRSLEWLSVDGNPLHTVPPGIGLLRNLTFLSMAFCDLNSLSANVFVNLNKLEVLDLSQNPSIVPTLDVLVHQKSLKTLRLLFLGSSFTDIPNAISEMEKLVELDLTGNGIREVNQNHFAKRAQLRKLNLNHNKIASLDSQAFQNCDQLEELDLSFNSLHGLTLINFVPRSLWLLNLNENEFETLDKCSVTKFLSNFQYSTMNVSSNRLTCDCRLAWVRKAVDRLSIHFYGTCYLPWQLYGQSVTLYTLNDCTLEDESFENCNNTSTTPTKTEHSSEALNRSFVNSAQLSSLRKDFSYLQTITSVSIFVAVVAIVAVASTVVLLQIYHFRERNRVPTYGCSQRHVNQGLQLSEQVQSERSLEGQSSEDIQYQNTDDTTGSGPGSDCVNAPPRYTGWV